MKDSAEAPVLCRALSAAMRNAPTGERISSMDSNRFSEKDRSGQRHVFDGADAFPHGGNGKNDQCNRRFRKDIDTVVD